MELMHAKLIRKNACGNGTECDYTICGDMDEYIKDHPEYKDEEGYSRNKMRRLSMQPFKIAKLIYFFSK